MMTLSEKALQKHREWNGKIGTAVHCPLKTREDLSLAYTPGVAAPCLAIRDDPALSYTLTARGNTVAVVTDGSAVLGLGNIGPEAGMPVMEGKCALFKAFGGVDTVPLCIRSQDPDEIVRTVSLLAGSFGGINLEDIAAPRCFEIERKLQEVCDIPVFHDDQHGTAVVVGAALLNACRLTGRSVTDCRCVINGPGAAGMAIAQHLLRLGVKDLILCGKRGILTPETAEGLQAELLPRLNPRGVSGSLIDALRGADVFVGVSVGRIVTKEMIAGMAADSIVFPMANPTPEISREEALEAGAYVVGTGRSDAPNQINNLLAFPGIFRGALDCRARCINDDMKLAATHALAALVPESELSRDCVIVSPFAPGVAQAVAAAVVKAARDSGVARI